MSIVFIVIGAICIISGISVCVMYALMVKRGSRMEAEICGTDESTPVGGTLSEYLKVKMTENGKERTINTVNTLSLVPFGMKKHIEGLKKAYAGRKVHIYYNPAKPYQTVIEELIWKLFLAPVWVGMLGIAALLAGILL